MSDLAPFVAAALRDKNVADLKQENDSLRQQLRQERRKSRAVTITGANGTPVYARAQMEEGKFCSDNGKTTWFVPLRQKESSYDTPKEDDEKDAANDDDVVSCPPSDLYHAEVRVGGICIASFRNILGKQVAYLPSHRAVLLFLQPSGNETVLDMGLGMAPFASQTAFNDFHRSLYEVENSDEIVGETPTVSFIGVQFHPHAIRGMIDNFEQLLEEFEQSRGDNNNHYGGDDDDDDDDDGDSNMDE